MNLSVAFTHYNRRDLLLEAFAGVVDDPRVDEIVVADDCSTDGSYEELQVILSASSKFRLFRNPRNVDCYRNKAAAVGYSRNPWVALWDCDNRFTSAYLDALEAVGELDPGTAYLPVFAEPDFDYREFSGLTVTRENVQQYVDQPMFLTALNTANYVVPRAAYLEVHNPNVDPVTADSIYVNLRWLLSGRALHFVTGMHYVHRIHPGSHFQLNHTPQLEAYKMKIEDQLRRLN